MTKGKKQKHEESIDFAESTLFKIVAVECIGHDLGQRVRIIQKRNRWADFKIIPEKFPFVVLWNLRRGFCNWIILAATGGLNFQRNSLL